MSTTEGPHVHTFQVIKVTKSIEDCQDGKGNKLYRMNTDFRCSTCLECADDSKFHHGAEEPKWWRE